MQQTCCESKQITGSQSSIVNSMNHFKLQVYEHCFVVDVKHASVSNSWWRLDYEAQEYLALQVCVSTKYYRSFIIMMWIPVGVWLKLKPVRMTHFSRPVRLERPAWLKPLCQQVHSPPRRATEPSLTVDFYYRMANEKRYHWGSIKFNINI